MPTTETLKRADFWELKENNKTLCTLCPRYCNMGDGQIGFCFIRKNIGGTLYSLAYGNPAAIHIDPIEKKPLFHFLPGTLILSVGSAGCNMGCKFCQNWNISKAKQDQVHSKQLSPQALVEIAIQNQCPSIAFTYNEPTIWAEYVMETSQLAHEKGLYTVMVTNGYITPSASDILYPHIDAANVDIKGFTDHFYRKITLSSLQPTLDTLKRLQKMGVHLEITNLIIPTYNDALEEIEDMVNWILQNLGNDVPLHFSAFHPDFKLKHTPCTPIQRLCQAREIAQEKGLRYVFIGNARVPSSGDTTCPQCHTLLIAREGYSTEIHGLERGRCTGCGERIPIQSVQ